MSTPNGGRRRIAGAPISWGVCEVAGWGHQMSATRVLGEMQSTGLAATEFGPDGFLPDNVSDRVELLSGFGLLPVGGFVPVVLHDPATDPLASLSSTLEGFLAAQATVVVLAADSGITGYDARVDLDADQWRTLTTNLDRINEHAADVGLTATLHPHVGTLVERPADVARVLDHSNIPLCLDTGHLLIGGVRPETLAEQAPERIRHVHLKDVDEGWAQRVQRGEVTYTEAVSGGMYRPLGAGDIEIGRIVKTLESSGYDGWFVLEQDTILSGDPAQGSGPIEDVRQSIAYLDKVFEVDG